MKIAAIGRGKVGGALARVWREAGHEVLEFGRDGGDATGSDVVLLAVPLGTSSGSAKRLRGRAWSTRPTTRRVT